MLTRRILLSAIAAGTVLAVAGGARAADDPVCHALRLQAEDHAELCATVLMRDFVTNKKGPFTGAFLMSGGGGVAHEAMAVVTMSARLVTAIKKRAVQPVR